jgi:hypothetical protein
MFFWNLRHISSLPQITSSGGCNSPKPARRNRSAARGAAQRTSKRPPHIRVPGRLAGKGRTGWKQPPDHERHASPCAPPPPPPPPQVGALLASQLEGLAPGEPPTKASGGSITARVENAGRLDSPSCTLFDRPLASAGGAGSAEVSLPSVCPLVLPLHPRHS